MSSSGGEIPKHGLRAHAVGLHTTETWCGQISLSPNPNKTDLIFTRKRKLPGFFESLFFWANLHCSMSVKYLRVVLDSWLTWGEHVNTKVKKAYNLLWACRKAQCGA